jgi:hypothetical protein
MADDPTRPDGVPNPFRSASAGKATTTLFVPRHAVVTAGLLSCDDGEFHTVTVTSPDGLVGVVLAGTVLDLTSALRAGLAVLPDEAGR